MEVTSINSRATLRKLLTLSETDSLQRLVNVVTLPYIKPIVKPLSKILSVFIVHCEFCLLMYSCGSEIKPPVIVLLFSEVRVLQGGIELDLSVKCGSVGQ